MSSAEKRVLRFFQFRLRTVFVFLTIACFWLGWRVEKARERGRAIDALLERGAKVTYANNVTYDGPRSGYHQGPRAWAEMRSGELEGLDHFWLDCGRMAVDVDIDQRLDEKVKAWLGAIYRIHNLRVFGRMSDSDVPYLESVDACRVSLYEADGVSEKAAEALRRKLPATIVAIPARSSLPPEERQ